MNPKRRFLARHTLILAVGLLVLPVHFFNAFFANPPPRLDLPSGRRSPPFRPAFMAYLQKVCSDPLVCALFGHLFSQTGHFVGSFCDIFRTLDEGSFVPTAASHQTGHLGHQQGHTLGRRNDVVPLEGKKSRRDRSGRPDDSHVLGLCRCCSTKTKQQDSNTKATCETLPIFSDHKLQPRGEGVDTVIRTQSTYRLVVLPK